MTAHIIRGDARALPLADNSVHAIITDPPYDLAFMGKQWDTTGVAFQPDTWREAHRVLKPGGHLAAFGGTRTFHRLAVAIEDAGFTIRDTIGILGWTYGSGFPKSLDISKALDNASGTERERGSERVYGDGHRQHSSAPRFKSSEYANGNVYWEPPVRYQTVPATAAAAQWQGWGTALKPAWEPIILARKPLAGTVADNVHTHGVGGLNIDGCRVKSAPKEKAPNEKRYNHSGATNFAATQGRWDGAPPEGRWPPNLLIIHHPDCCEHCADGCHVAEMDRQSGQSKSSGGSGAASAATMGKLYGYEHAPAPGSWRNAGGLGDTGGASRYFPTFRYQAKAGRNERPTVERDGHTVMHPTVKPVALMRWLCRLLTPPGGTILDTFAGSGATLQAAQIEGFASVGVELQPEYVDLIRHRLAQPAHPDPPATARRSSRPTPTPTAGYEQTPLFE